MTATARRRSRRECSVCGDGLDETTVPGVRGGSVTVLTCRRCDRLYPRAAKKKGR